MTSETPAAPNIRYPALIEANNRWQNETRTHAIRRDSFIQGAEWAAALAARPTLDVEALALRRNVLIHNDYGFRGRWVAIPRSDFDRLRAEYARLAPQEPSPEEPA